MKKSEETVFILSSVCRCKITQPLHYPCLGGGETGGDSAGSPPGLCSAGAAGTRHGHQVPTTINQSNQITSTGKCPNLHPGSVKKGGILSASK